MPFEIAAMEGEEASASAGRSRGGPRRRPSESRPGPGPADQENVGALRDLAPQLQRFRDDVVAGLSRTPPELPSKYLYDEAGSRLFEEICELEVYYPTRTELSILQKYAGEIAD